MKVNRKQQITLDALSFKGREAAYVKFLGPMTRSDRVDQTDDGREPATTARVLNLEDGVQYRLVCPALLVSALTEDALEYVGHCYEIRVSSQPRPGKRYKTVEVYEIDEPVIEG